MHFWTESISLHVSDLNIEISNTMRDGCMDHINATTIIYITSFFPQSFSQKTTLLNVRNHRKREILFHCYALSLHTGQVESLSSFPENNLFPQKIWRVLCFCNCPAPRERIADE